MVADENTDGGWLNNCFKPELLLVSCFKTLKPKLGQIICNTFIRAL